MYSHGYVLYFFSCDAIMTTAFEFVCALLALCFHSILVSLVSAFSIAVYGAGMPTSWWLYTAVAIAHQRFAQPS